MAFIKKMNINKINQLSISNKNDSISFLAKMFSNAEN